MTALKNKLKNIFVVIVLIFLLTVILPITVRAYDCPECDSIVCCGNAGQDPCTFNDIFCLVSKIVNFILFTIIPALAVIWFTYAGFIILTAAGNPNKVKQGRDMITYACLGILIAYSAWMLVYWFVSFIGGESQANWLLQFFQQSSSPQSPP
ncbi:MAG TPA: hypothetical protein PL093_00575 [Candidatus Pacearchaeota archaeon]|jgi:hypothetical protein|nr:hypothetical protein [Candidatus Pacearchaeota archaeon]HQH20057.1 hypothetical protein [Candidatus Pacearchaeota archaeon]HQK58242.1 hypothetical protein [Candidatus Pacearchaeota archaeon]HRU20576.1 hypothetical protein [Candidatus Paceibacterota bacterium]